LKLLIDSFQKEGKYALLADAVMYMLSSLKDNQPEFIKKVKPIIEHKQLLDTDVILSLHISAGDANPICGLRPWRRRS